MLIVLTQHHSMTLCHFFFVLPRTAMPCVVPPCTSCRLMIDDSRKGTLLCFASWCICAATSALSQTLLHPPPLTVLPVLMERKRPGSATRLGQAVPTQTSQTTKAYYATGFQTDYSCGQVQAHGGR